MLLPKVLKGVERFWKTPKPTCLLGTLSLCVLVFVSSPLFGQDGVIQRITAPLAAPIQSVQSALTSQPHAPQASPVNSALPGLGTLKHQPSIPPPVSPVLPPPDNTHLVPSAEGDEPIIIAAQAGWKKEIDEHIVYFLQGCSIQYGHTIARSPEAVIWIATERDATTNHREVTLYLESRSPQMPLQVVHAGVWEDVPKQWLAHWHTRAAVDVRFATQLPPQDEPAIYWRALAMKNPGEIPPVENETKETATDEKVIQTQFISSSSVPQINFSEMGFRRVQLTPRSDNTFGIDGQPYDPSDHSKGWIIVLTGGINLVVEGISGQYDMLSGSTVDISADNVVVWTENSSIIHGGGSYTESASNDFEVYLEGNIIYRDGPRVIRASRMYYDAKHKVAYILDGDLVVPITEIAALPGARDTNIRLKAAVLRQMGEGLFTARNALVTTSQLGQPTYSLRSQTMRLDRQAARPFGSSESGFRQVLVAESNYIALRNFPIFYWPWMATDVDNPAFYLTGLSYGSSTQNGHTVKTRWDPFQILNIRRPDGTDADVDVSWLEKRGIGHGATFRYNQSSCCGVPGETNGRIFYWGIHDKGKDRLGGARRNVGFADPYRYRFQWGHQQQADFSLPLVGGPWNLRAEVGKTSDRNFLNSYFNDAWNSEANATTAIDLTRTEENTSFTFTTEYALDKHYTNANWLPRLDHFWLGESLLNDHLTWYQHTRVGLMNYHTADAPTDVTEWNPTTNRGAGRGYFYYLPWEVMADSPSNTPNSAKTVDETGLVFSTRHELDLPIQAGVFKVVPYVLGDFSAWGQDRSGNATDRLYGQTGVRVNLPIWKVNPRVSNRTWYVNGLAHKIDLNAEYMYGQANRSMDELILSDPLDHWSTEDFRRRYLRTNSYFGSQMGGIWYHTMPEMFDPRYYALRSGMAGNVTAGNMEIADDMHMLRVGMTHRFQTKRGPVGKRRILDWITFSTHMNYYPQTQYNYGESVGLVDYNVLWHVGDRFSLFSEGLYDVFENGQNLTRIGGTWQRSERGNVSLIYDQFSGVVERQYLSMGVGYTMNEKYAMSYSTSYDIKNDWRNAGHNFLFTRTGESFRLLIGARYSESLDEWSVTFGIEPVFVKMKRQMLGADSFAL